MKPKRRSIATWLLQPNRGIAISFPSPFALLNFTVQRASTSFRQPCAGHQVRYSQRFCLLMISCFSCHPLTCNKRRIHKSGRHGQNTLPGRAASQNTAPSVSLAVNRSQNDRCIRRRLTQLKARKTQPTQTITDQKLHPLIIHIVPGCKNQNLQHRNRIIRRATAPLTP